VDNTRGGIRSGGRRVQQKRGESESPEGRKREEGRPRRSQVVTKYDDGQEDTEVYHCRGGRYESWRPSKG